MKRFLPLLLGLLLILTACTSCASGTQDDDTLTVVCTSFAPYDWARNIVGDTEGIELILLADGGKDMHSYSPSAADSGRGQNGADYPRAQKRGKERGVFRTLQRW